MVKVTIPDAVLNPQDPSYNETLGGLAVNAEFRAAEKINTGENVIYTDIADDKLSFDIADLIIANGGEVEDWQLFIEINSADDTVPTGFIGDVVEDEDGNETTNTWSTWLRANNYVIERDNRLFVATRGHTGKDLSYSKLDLVKDALVRLDELPVVDIQEL